MLFACHIDFSVMQSRQVTCASQLMITCHAHATGILVLNARDGGPAFKAGIHGTTRDDYGRLVLGDIITSINGSKVRNSSDLYRLLDKSKVRSQHVKPRLGLAYLVVAESVCVRTRTQVG